MGAGVYLQVRQNIYRAICLMLIVLVPVLAGAEGITMKNTHENDGLQSIKIVRNGSQPSSRGPDKWFTGTVRIDPVFSPPEPTRAFGASVTFEPSARTAWHTHPLGQTLVVTSGSGLVQKWGEKAEEICPGDVVWIPPGVKHWHGATPTTAMTHIAIQEKLDGSAAEWFEKVSDEQYSKK